MNQYEESKDYIVQGKVLGVEFTNAVYSTTGETFSSIIDHNAYLYSQSNYSCDCNKRIFAGISDVDEENNLCGDDIAYEELFLVHKDGTKIDLLKEGWFKID